MKNDRLNQILGNLNGLGTKPNTLYTNQEIIDRLTELQGAMARGVFEKAHAENLRDRDIMIHLGALAKEYDLDETDTYYRFKTNMREFGYTIGSLIKGMAGERIAKRALKLLSYDDGVRILYNIQLEDEDVQAEYDAIVVAPFGLFVIEVKNWGTKMTISPTGLLTRNDNNEISYDIPGRMSIKEALLREHLQGLFPENYHNMLLLSNERAKVKDDYQKIPISFGGGISYEIKAYANHEDLMSEEQMDKIVETILSQHKEQRALCTVKCDEIIADYARLMVQIEEASNTGYKDVSEMQDEESLAVTWYDRVNWKRLAMGMATVVIPGILAIAANRKK